MQPDREAIARTLPIISKVGSRCRLSMAQVQQMLSTKARRKPSYPSPAATFRADDTLRKRTKEVLRMDCASQLDLEGAPDASVERPIDVARR